MKVNNITIIMIICIVTSGFHIKYRKKKQSTLKEYGGEKKEQVPAIEAFPPSNEPYFWLYKHTQKPPQYLNTIHLQIFFFLKVYT